MSGQGAAESLADRWVLRPGRSQIPGTVDPALAASLLPLLRRGASKPLLVGHVAVNDGLDSVTALARVEQFLNALSEANALSVKPG